jgi:hypothetical protein
VTFSARADSVAATQTLVDRHMATIHIIDRCFESLLRPVDADIADGVRAVIHRTFSLKLSSTID